jgi:cell division transport system ATP-binding protein
MIALSDVSKWYHGKNKILEGIQLTLKKGEFLYLVGGSGAGKSTLLRLIASEETPSVGNVSLFGYDLAKASSTTLQAIRRLIGYIPQNIRLIQDLTVLENVSLSLSLAGYRVLSKESKSKISELLHRLSLEDKRDRLASTLSGGEAQRVAVARALVRSPEIIVADEPTGAQDKDHRWLLMDLFLKSNQMGATVVLATHDRELVRRVRKKCALLRGGQVVIEEALCIY